MLLALSMCGNVVVGNGNNVCGNDNVINHGDGNQVEGNGNELAHSMRNSILGNLNSLFRTNNLKVHGDEHHYEENSEVSSS